MKREVLTPNRIGLIYDDEQITLRDGVKLHAWFLPAHYPPKGTVIFLHGNAENISTHIASVYWMPEQHFNVLMYDYRGYGSSEGEPDLETSIDDLDDVIAYTLKHKEVDPSKVFVFGQSLGGAIAINGLAKSKYRKQIKALIIESSFTGFREIAREKLSESWVTWPFQYPLSFLITADHKPRVKIKSLSPMPVMIAHGAKDYIIPVKFGRELYAAAKEPKLYVEMTNGEHITGTLLQSYRKLLVHFLESVLAGSPDTGKHILNDPLPKEF